MVVKVKHDLEKMEKGADGIEVQKEDVETLLVSQVKMPKRKLGNEEKVQALLELIRNMNITLPIFAVLEHNPSYIRFMKKKNSKQCELRQIEEARRIVNNTLVPKKKKQWRWKKIIET